MFFTPRTSRNSISKKSSTTGLFGRGMLVGLSMSVLCVVVLNFSPFSASALNDTILSKKDIESVVKDFGDTTRSIESLSSEYHSSVNSIMNGYMKTFFVGIGKDPKAKPVTAPPKQDSDCDAIGPTMNVSTYCLFVRIDPLSKAYTTALTVKQNTAIQEIQDTLNGTQSATADYYTARGEWINRELTSTQKALDSGLQAYSELLLQYPMHQEYQKTITDLVKYYDGLADMRKNVDTYPARFQDVTTAQCDH